jgi:hypothetical protein
MTLSTFPTFLAFLTRKLDIRATQKTLPESRREALGRRLAAEQTRSLLDGLVRAGWLRLVTTKGAAALSIGGVSIRCSFPGHQCQKGQEGRKGGARHDSEHLSDLSDLPAPAGAPCQNPEIPPYAGRQRLGAQTVEPKGDHWNGPPEAASTLCRALTRNSDRSASESRAHALPLLAERT